MLFEASNIKNMNKKVYVVGVGMTKFVKPNTEIDYPEFGKEAVEEALRDSGVSYDNIQQAVCGYVYGNSACGQRVLYQVGMTGIPIINVNNHGATGATALFIAHQVVQGGVADVVLALGFEKMAPGILPGTAFPDRTYPMDKHQAKILEIVTLANAPPTAQYFGNAAIEHMKKYGTTELQFAKIAHKNHQNGLRNPWALNNQLYTLGDIINSKHIFGPLTKLQCCSNSNGGAAAILMSEKAVAHYNLYHKAVEILGMSMASDTEAIFNENSMIKIAGYDMTTLAAKQVYDKTGISPNQIDVVELHDCFSTNELITYESLQLCKEGSGGDFVDAGDNTYGGKVVVNPSGGLLAKGNPIGATGLAQCAELVWQLRGEAEGRQVPNARIGLQHNLGLGGAVVVAIYRSCQPHQSANHIVKLNNTSTSESFRVHEHLRALEKIIKTRKKDQGYMEGIFGIKVLGSTGSEGYWVVNTKEDPGKITYMGTEKPDVVFSGKDDDMVNVMTGKSDPVTAYYGGKLKVQGDVALALKMQISVAGRTRAKI